MSEPFSEQLATAITGHIEQSLDTLRRVMQSDKDIDYKLRTLAVISNELCAYATAIREFKECLSADQI